MLILDSSVNPPTLRYVNGTVKVVLPIDLSEAVLLIRAAYEAGDLQAQRPAPHQGNYWRDPSYVAIDADGKVCHCAIGAMSDWFDDVRFVVSTLIRHNLVEFNIGGRSIRLNPKRRKIEDALVEIQFQHDTWAAQAEIPDKVYSMAGFVNALIDLEALVGVPWNGE